MRVFFLWCNPIFDAARRGALDKLATVSGMKKSNPIFDAARRGAPEDWRDYSGVGTATRSLMPQGVEHMREILKRSPDRLQPDLGCRKALSTGRINRTARGRGATRSLMPQGVEHKPYVAAVFVVISNPIFDAARRGAHFQFFSFMILHGQPDLGCRKALSTFLKPVHMFPTVLQPDLGCRKALSTRRIRPSFFRAGWQPDLGCRKALSTGISVDGGGVA